MNCARYISVCLCGLFQNVAILFPLGALSETSVIHYKGAELPVTLQGKSHLSMQHVFKPVYKNLNSNQALRLLQKLDIKKLSLINWRLYLHKSTLFRRECTF